ncbi:MAG: response regulator [Deltaproteobacteria bacterium]|nr:response regulator [Deltaproteobacteria bacterium]
MEQKTRILLIDDETDYSDTMGFYLKAKGYRVRTAQSGQEGIEEIEREKPDIVFLDFMMPIMNGAETLKKIREAHTDLPVIMVTSYASEKLIDEATGLGITAIFPKAEDFSIAARLIQEALETVRN